MRTSTTSLDASAAKFSTSLAALITLAKARAILVGALSPLRGSSYVPLAAAPGTKNGSYVKGPGLVDGIGRLNPVGNFDRSNIDQDSKV